jgi:hypothetical protein
MDKEVFKNGTIVTPEFLNNIQDLIFGNTRNLKVFEVAENTFHLGGWSENAIVRYTGQATAIAYHPQKLPEIKNSIMVFLPTWGDTDTIAEQNPDADTRESITVNFALNESGTVDYDIVIPRGNMAIFFFAENGGVSKQPFILPVSHALTRSIFKILTIPQGGQVKFDTGADGFKIDRFGINGYTFMPVPGNYINLNGLQASRGYNGANMADYLTTDFISARESVSARRVSATEFGGGHFSMYRITLSGGIKQYISVANQSAMNIRHLVAGNGEVGGAFIIVGYDAGVPNQKVIYVTGDNLTEDGVRVTLINPTPFDIGLSKGVDGSSETPVSDNVAILRPGCAIECIKYGVTWFPLGGRFL